MSGRMDKALAWDLGAAQGAQLCDVTSQILGKLLMVPQPHVSVP